MHKIKRIKYRLLVSQAKIPEFFSNHLYKSNEQELNAILGQEGYYSQCGQDKWLAEEIFPNKKSGVFIDIGAHDGVSFSNTFFLEKKLNWTGLAIEPIPELYKQLKKNRKCRTLHGCVSDKSGEVEFLSIDGQAQMLSGITSKYNKAHWKRIDRECALSPGSTRKLLLPCFTLNEILQKESLYHIDYLSIDVEGSEYSILNNFNFKRFHISVIGIENNYHEYCIPQLLKKNGFCIHSILGADEFYINSQLKIASK